MVCSSVAVVNITIVNWMKYHGCDMHMMLRERERFREWITQSACVRACRVWLLWDRMHVCVSEGCPLLLVTKQQHWTARTDVFPDSWQCLIVSVSDCVSVSLCQYQIMSVSICVSVILCQCLCWCQTVSFVSLCWCEIVLVSYCVSKCVWLCLCQIVSQSVFPSPSPFLSHKYPHKLTHAHPPAHACVHTQTHSHWHTLMHTHTHACTHTHTHTHAPPPHTHTLMHTHTQTDTHSCTHTHAHTPTHTHLCTHTHTQTDTHTHAHTHTHSDWHTHSCTHTHTHAQTPPHTDWPAFLQHSVPPRWSTGRGSWRRSRAPTPQVQTLALCWPAHRTSQTMKGIFTDCLCPVLCTVNTGSPLTYTEQYLSKYKVHKLHLRYLLLQ